MPPAGLSKEQYYLWRSDPNLKASFPHILEGDPHHLSGSFTLQDKWAEWEKTHPDIIKKAHDLVAAEEGTPPTAISSSEPVRMALPVNNDELVKAINRLADAIELLAPTEEVLKKHPIVQKLIEEATTEKCGDCDAGLGDDA